MIQKFEKRGNDWYYEEFTDEEWSVFETAMAPLVASVTELGRIKAPWLWLGPFSSPCFKSLKSCMQKRDVLFLMDAVSNLQDIARGSDFPGKDYFSSKHSGLMNDFRQAVEAVMRDLDREFNWSAATRGALIVNRGALIVDEFSKLVYKVQVVSGRLVVMWFPVPNVEPCGKFYIGKDGRKHELKTLVCEVV